MVQHYLNPKDAEHPTRLPNIETWESTIWELECSRGCGSFDVDEDYATVAAPDCYCPSCGYNSSKAEKTDRIGWFYWFCFPGCLPDSSPMGPFDSEDDALADAREGFDQ